MTPVYCDLFLLGYSYSKLYRAKEWTVESSSTKIWSVSKGKHLKSYIPIYSRLSSMATLYMLILTLSICTLKLELQKSWLKLYHFTCQLWKLISRVFRARVKGKSLQKSCALSGKKSSKLLTLLKNLENPKDLHKSLMSKRIWKIENLKRF